MHQYDIAYNTSHKADAREPRRVASRRLRSLGFLLSRVMINRRWNDTFDDARKERDRSTDLIKGCGRGRLYVRRYYRRNLPVRYAQS